MSAPEGLKSRQLIDAEQIADGLDEHERELLLLLDAGTPPTWGAWVGAVGEVLHGKRLVKYSYGGECTERGRLVAMLLRQKEAAK